MAILDNSRPSFRSILENMNKSQLQPVLLSMFRIPKLCGLLLPALLASCSSSRLVDSDRVFDPGEHVVGSIINTDILIPDGANVETKYIAGNRIFIQSGGSLSGLSKGAKNSTIYAEEGVALPAIKNSGSVSVKRVDDAEQAFRDRFKNLLPTDARSSNPDGTVVGLSLIHI